MNCYYHPNREIVGMCVSCGKPICVECKVVLGEKFYCNPCAEKIFTGKAETAAIIVENTSGRRSSAVVPKEVHGWNWGGFLLSWIWAIGNKVWIGVLLGLFAGVALIIVDAASEVDNIEWIGIGLLAAIVIHIVLGLKGSEWAWRNKRWDSIEHFKRTQITWAWWGVGVLIFFAVVSIISSIMETFGTY